MSIFKKEHVLNVRYPDSKYIDRFLDLYQIDRDADLEIDSIRYRIEMHASEFSAFCEYLFDLNRLGVYPILL